MTEGAKKSLNKLWREMGKPVSFKQFAEEYNKADLYYQKVEDVYHNATSIIETPSEEQNIVETAPNVATSKNNYYIVGAILLVIGGILITQTLSKKSN